MVLFKYARLLLLVLICLVLLTAFEFGIGFVPALGPVLSPFHGLFQNQPDRLERTDSILRLDGVKDRLNVYFDKHSVPHIYANNAEDLFFMQGYLQARDRLFQMDMMTRLTSGRLAEVVGEQGLKSDKFFVSIGMRESADRILAMMMQDEQTKLALVSFANGVNSWIEGLSSRERPFEYKLLNFNPDKWTEIRTVHLLLAMSYFLSGQSYDPLFTSWIDTVGVERIKEVFPLVPPQTTPIFRNLVSSNSSPLLDQVQPFKSLIKQLPNWMLKDDGGASNSWAVGPSKASQGVSILANDTHLGYGYPNSWYEIHLVAPGIDVYGASFPAAPGVIIGANPKVAWGVTNATIDAVDWLEVKVRDDRTKQYFYDNQWISFKENEHIIKIKGLKKRSEKVVVAWTHQGVVVDQSKDTALVMRWLPHEPSNTLKIFLQLNQARDYAACKFILRDYEYPAQNFICADSQQVGARQNGKAPLRDPGEGRFILDGSLTESDWTEWVSWDELPSEDNADMVATANQHATGSRYEHYLNWHYEDSFRGERIYSLLESQERFSVDDFIRWHGDVKDLLAEQAIRELSRDLSELRSRSSLSDDTKQMIGLLLAWDFEANSNSVAASIFLVFWEQLKIGIWQDQLPPQKNFKVFPSNKVLISMLRDDANKVKSGGYWFDDINTTEVETRLDQIETALTKTEVILKETLGAQLEKWVLADYKYLRFEHIAKIPGFGSRKLAMGGMGSTLNANRSVSGQRRAGHGAVWRMVVEMSERPKIFTSYPGGQSGNPFDKRFDSFTNDWVDGKMKEAVYVATPKEFKEWSGIIQVVPK